MMEHDKETKRWLVGEVDDIVRIFGSNASEAFSAFNLVLCLMLSFFNITPESYEKIWKENSLLLGTHNLV